MPIDSHHPQYNANLFRWEKCRHVVEGEDTIKHHGETYLHKLGDQDETEYEAYKQRALFYGATQRTVKGLAGAVLRKAPEITFSDDTLLDNIGTNDEPFDLICKKAIDETLTTGRLGVYVDAPEDGDGAPYITLYYPENIINWRHEKVDGRSALVMVVLREEVECFDDADEFMVEEEEHFRVLKLLDPDGTNPIFTVDVWRKTEEKDEAGKLVEAWERVMPTMTPRRAGGKNWDEIPFEFINPSGVGPEIEEPPINDLANANLSHYRSTADIEHGCHFTALPTAYACGFDLSNKSKLRIGSATAWTTDNPNAKVGYLEFSGSGLKAIEERLTKKESLMAVLGARLLEEQKAGVEAAATVQLRQSGEHSVLSNIAHSVSSGLTRALGWIEKWRGLDSAKASCTLNQEYFTGAVNPMLLAQLVAMVQANLMPIDDFFYNIQRWELVSDEMSLDDYLSNIKKGLPMPTPPLSANPGGAEPAAPGAKPTAPKAAPGGGGSKGNPAAKVSVTVHTANPLLG